MNKSVLTIGGVAALAIMLFPFGGCGSSGSSGLLREQGLFAYNGSHVESRGTMVERWLEGSEKNRIDVLKAKKPSGNFERVKIFVENSEVEDLSRNKDVVLDRTELVPLLTRATEASIVNFGRFDRVTSRDRADLIAQTRLYGVSAWADSSLKADELAGYIGRHDGSSALREHVKREAVDVHVSIAFSRPDGTVISSERAMGRLVATSGSAIQSGNFAYGGAGSGTGSTSLEVTNAKINPTELPRVLGIAVDGAVAATLEGANLKLWSKEADASGVYTLIPSFKNVAAATGPQ